MKLRRPINNALPESYYTITLRYCPEKAFVLCAHCSLHNVSPSFFFFFLCQVESCWTPPSTAPLATLTQWSTRSVTVLDFTTYFEAYRRLSRATTRVWRLSRRWRPEICARTPTPRPNTKAATIQSRATKPVAVGISHTRHLTTTWVMQVRRRLPGQNIAVIPLARKNRHRDGGICWVCVHTETGVEFSRDTAGGTSFHVTHLVQKWNICCCHKGPLCKEVQKNSEWDPKINFLTKWTF